MLYTGYGQQLSDCRESLEQLEGYQNQELAKVKHMLLSAETSLELEKQERLKLRDQLEELQTNQTTNETDQFVVQSKDTATNTPPVANSNDTDKTTVTEYTLVINGIMLPLLIILYIYINIIPQITFVYNFAGVTFKWRIIND